METTANITKAHCNSCVGERNNLYLHKHEKVWDELLADDPPYWIDGKDIYELLQCAGCDRITLRHTSWCNQDYDEDGKPLKGISYYPPPIFRRQPNWLSGREALQFFIGPASFVPRLLKEIYTALHDNCPSLAAMGIRALLERVMIAQVTDRGTFAKNLTAFKQEGYISERQQEIFAATLEVRHASSHRSYNPSSEDLRMTLDITENILESVYVSGKQATTLKKRIPERKKNH